MLRLASLIAFVTLISTYINASEFKDLDYASLDVTVSLNDGAEDGCWTNLKEVRDYAEGSLQNRGINILPPPYKGQVKQKIFELYISVLGGRIYEDGTGGCYGSLDVALRAPEIIDDVIYYAEYTSLTGVIFSPDTNLNRRVLDGLSEYFRDYMK